jgi:HEPN domain-containing protein
MQLKRTNDKDPADWFDTALERLKIADLIWTHEGFTATGVECLHEAAERSLKGYLIANGWSLQRTHDLELLTRAAVGFNAQFSEFLAPAAVLTEKFFEQHYPGGDLTKLADDYETLRTKVGEMIEFIKISLPKFFPKK